jgi:lipopolysaccharide heptosyltransferase I
MATLPGREPSTTNLPVVDGRRVRRLLIVKLSSLGDVVHALPAVAALRARFPALHLTWAVEARFAPLVRLQGAVDGVVELPRLDWGAPGRAWWAAVRRALGELHAVRADAVLDLQGLLKSAMLALAARAPLRLGVAPQREGARLVARPVPLPSGRRHVVETHLAAAAWLGAAATPVRFGLRVDPAAGAAVARRLAAAGLGGAPLIVVNPSASRPGKRWPAAHWATVIDGLRRDGAVVVVGGREQRTAHAALVAGGGAALDLTGETSLPELAALLARASLHLAADTGSLHLAAALGRAVVGVYGPTPTWRLGPWGQPQAALSGAAACGATCPRLCLSRRRCLAAVTPAAVLAHARRVLASGAPPATPITAS